MMKHDSVLLKETLELLAPKKGETVLDCTLGLGGHSQKLLDAVGKTGFLVGLDADRFNLKFARERLGEPSNALFLHTNFSTLPDCLPDDHQSFDCILADLGLSSPHIDDSSRGFTFREDAPLDMRYDRERGLMASHYIQSIDQKKLFTVLKDYGELPRVPALLRAILARRSSTRIRTSFDLVEVAKDVYRHDAKKFLPQIFQAVRIAVNDEISSLLHLLSVAPTLLNPGGRFVVISYHSLEDRPTKEHFKFLTKDTVDLLTGAVTQPAEYEMLTRKPVKPTDAEIARNPRARSAILRALQKKTVYDFLRTS